MVGKYIVIEGQDATGKDTQAKLLVDYLKSKGEGVTTYSESGTNSESEFIKTIAKLNYGSDQIWNQGPTHYFILSTASNNGKRLPSRRCPVEKL